ncbi:MAG: DUF2723 domain-containing protein [Chloroflexi bacterium]|nr:DUF2723 domain-containing protein [Chloroflexota bacterium]
MKIFSRIKTYHLPLTTYDTLLALALFLASLALYARTAAPGLLDGDEGEFQTNIARLGVSHTGYPLFFLLGKLFTILVPIGTMATRANLFAAFWGAMSVAAIFVFLKFFTGNRWVALVSALLLAASRVEWSQAIIPRPYTLNAFFVVIIPFLFFLWRAGKIDLLVPVFAFGLSLTNHRTMIWFVPAIAFYVLRFEGLAIFHPRRLISLAFAFLAPLILYGYVFWRGESDVGVEFHLKDFGEMILGGNAGRWMKYGPLDWITSRVTDLYVPLLIEQFTPLAIITGLIGIAALALNRAPRYFPRDLPARETLLFIALANLANSAFCVFFFTIDVEKFFIPSYITFLFLAAMGLAVIWDWLARYRASQIAFIAIFLAATGFLLQQNYARNDWSRRTEIATLWQENLAQPLEQNALIVGPWEALTPLEYAQYVDGARRDLERWKVITQKLYLDLAAYDSRQADIERAVRAGRPVYLTFHPSETETLGALADEFRLTRVGELWRVVNCGLQIADCGSPIKDVRAMFSDQEGRAIELLGYALTPANPRAGDFVLLTLLWRAPQPVNARFTISFRLIDAQNNKLVQRDAEPASGLRPTIGWAPEEIVQDDVGFFALETPRGNVFTLGELMVK